MAIAGKEAALELLRNYLCVRKAVMQASVKFLPKQLVTARVAAAVAASHPTGVKADVERNSLILETGVNQRWRYGGWRPSPDSIAEAEGWEEAKAGLEGLHFLAVQPDPDSEELNGLWLLLDKLPPSV